MAVYTDINSEMPYRLHFFELGIRGQNTKGEPQTLMGELMAVREQTGADALNRFEVVPADILLDLPAHPAAARSTSTLLTPVRRRISFSSGYQSELRARVPGRASTVCASLPRLSGGVVQSTHRSGARIA